jgi:glycosyltransferase involved in cell wall biosynthesis
MIVCNVRVLRAPLTGVQRYTLELLKRKPDTVRTVQPPEVMKGPLGHVWEQALLPLEARGHLLWSPASTGPINARLLGRIDDADLPTLLTAAGVFVYPSLYEGFGLPPLEAMACGTPCLVANGTALPETTAGAALAVDPVDVADIARGLSKILGDAALRQQLRAKGLEHAAGFTWDRTAAKTYRVLSSYAQ